MIVGIHHVAIVVPDLDRALAFYRDALGFAVVQEGDWDGDYAQADRVIGLKKTSARIAMLKAPNAYLEIWQYRHPEPEDRRSRPCDLGYPHFALQVTDIEAEYHRLAEAGMTFAADAPVNLGTTSAIYGKDPFGNIIELYEIRDPAVAQLQPRTEQGEQP
ncbi:MAG: VOC family protein [Gammaproteobacteria bacterium]|nr:VOC family protein [Gammaproteobacteria bacterium]